MYAVRKIAGIDYTFKEADGIEYALPEISRIKKDQIPALVRRYANDRALRRAVSNEKNTKEYLEETVLKNITVGVNFYNGKFFHLLAMEKKKKFSMEALLVCAKGRWILKEMAIIEGNTCPAESVHRILERAATDKGIGKIALHAEKAEREAFIQLGFQPTSSEQLILKF